MGDKTAAVERPTHSSGILEAVLLGEDDVHEYDDDEHDDAQAAGRTSLVVVVVAEAGHDARVHVVL